MRHKPRRFSHDLIEDAGRISHDEVDHILHRIRGLPVNVTGARDTPEEALANLLTALEQLGLIVDSTTAS
jgi:hypothetical protein